MITVRTFKVGDKVQVKPETAPYRYTVSWHDPNSVLNNIPDVAKLVLELVKVDHDRDWGVKVLGQEYRGFLVNERHLKPYVEPVSIQTVQDASVEPIKSYSSAQYLRKDIPSAYQTLALSKRGSIVVTNEAFTYSNLYFGKANYGRIVKDLGRYVVVYWERELLLEGCYSDRKHWIVPKKYLTAIDHRAVEPDFKTTEEVNTLKPTLDKQGVLGKHYFLQDGTEVIALDSSTVPITIHATYDFQSLSAFSMAVLHEYVTEHRTIAPTARLK